MSFLNWIVEDLNAASDFFYDIYREVLDWVYPFWLAAGFFYDLSRVFNWLAYDFADFAEWVYDTVDKLGTILSWSTILSLIRSWLPDLEDVVDWWNSWRIWVFQEIANWWSFTQTAVQGWIDTATQGLSELITAWDNFWTVIFPTLVDFTGLATWWTATMGEVLNLIDTAFTLRASLWEGWQEIRNQVVEFFADPLEWLYSRFEEFFERFW